MKKETLTWKPAQVFKIYPDSKAKSLFPHWWDRLLNWFGFRRQEWYMRRIFKTYEEIAGKNETK